MIEKGVWVLDLSYTYAPTEWDHHLNNPCQV